MKKQPKPDSKLKGKLAGTIDIIVLLGENKNTDQTTMQIKQSPIDGRWKPIVRIIAQDINFSSTSSFGKKLADSSFSSDFRIEIIRFFKK